MVAVVSLYQSDFSFASGLDRGLDFAAIPQYLVVVFERQQPLLLAYDQNSSDGREMHRCYERITDIATR